MPVSGGATQGVDRFPADPLLDHTATFYRAQNSYWKRPPETDFPYRRFDDCDDADPTFMVSLETDFGNDKAQRILW